MFVLLMGEGGVQQSAPRVMETQHKYEMLMCTCVHVFKTHNMEDTHPNIVTFVCINITQR